MRVAPLSYDMAGLLGEGLTRMDRMAPWIGAALFFILIMLILFGAQVSNTVWLFNF